jgi:hypothetical protein
MLENRTAKEFIIYALLFSGQVLHKDFHAVFRLEFADETRVPAPPIGNEPTVIETVKL